MTKQISNKIAVLKFGSSVLAKERDIHQAIHEVYSYIRKNYKVIIVVSAIGNETDELDHLAKHFFSDSIAPEPETYATLLATGEIRASSLFLIGLKEVGIPATKLNYNCLKTTGCLLDATPIHLNKRNILKLFEHHSVLVMPGFLGVDRDSKETSLLGRGGSDYTAIYLASALHTDLCVLYKDTDGIYNDDPTVNIQAKRYKTINYDDCLKLSYPVIQHKALHFAKQHAVPIIVKSINGFQQTEVFESTSTIDLLTEKKKSKPLKVALLGLGTVGLGVYHYLIHARDHFELVGIGIKHPKKVRATFIPQSLLTRDLSTLIEQSDVIVDVTGDLNLAFDIISNSLKQKRHVITANKFLIGQHGKQLSQLANQHAQLLYSATVGGGIPILEVLNDFIKQKPKHNIESVYGILNGTSNFIFEKVSLGETFEQAIKLAQFAGFAESNTDLDLNGFDAAEKLNIIATLIFNSHIKELKVSPLSKDKLTKTEDRVMKQVAECKVINDTLHASVKQVAVPKTHPLAKVTGADNCLFIRTTDGEVIFLKGKGAGRWPTALSVFADLLTIRIQHVATLHEETVTPFTKTRDIHHETFHRACTY